MQKSNHFFATYVSPSLSVIALSLLHISSFLATPVHGVSPSDLAAMRIIPISSSPLLLTWHNPLSLNIRPIASNFTSMLLRMPGSFPGDNVTVPTESLLASDIVEHASLYRFAAKQDRIQASRAQRNLLSTLNVLIYILVWYQFVRFYFLAALTPAVLHLAVQKAILVATVVNSVHGSSLLSSAGAVGVIPIINDMANQQSTDPIRVTTLVCCLIYWKTIIIILYDLLLLFLWVIPLVKDGRLNELQYGTWWFVSFIGETPPQVDPEASIPTRLLQLGFGGMLALNLSILFIQLVLFQCIYHQLTAAPQGRTLTPNEIEPEIIRLAGDSSATSQGTSSSNNSTSSVHRFTDGVIGSKPLGVGVVDGSDCTQDEPPTVLQVRLFQVFSWRSFTTWSRNGGIGDAQTSISHKISKAT